MTSCPFIEPGEIEFYHANETSCSIFVMKYCMSRSMQGSVEIFSLGEPCLLPAAKLQCCGRGYSFQVSRLGGIYLSLQLSQFWNEMH